MTVNASEVRTILHVGCGPYHPELLPIQFRTEDWKELRLDINPDVKPDIIGDITHMPAVASESVDVVYSSHNIEHLYPHEVMLALKEFWRVLKPQGFVFLTLPDIQEVARHVAEGNLEGTLYTAPAGPIAAIDILYGLRSALENGNYYMAHKTGFTSKSLHDKLVEAGFVDVNVDAHDLNLCGVGFKW